MNEAKRMWQSRQRRAGFSLLEVMMALVVLLVALVGAVAGLIAGAQSFHDGQIRQSRMVLAEAKMQWLEMSLRSGAGGSPPPIDSVAFVGGSTGPMGSWLAAGTTGNPENNAIGTSPWFPDPTPSTCPSGCTNIGATNLSTGAYFNITADGTITHNTTVAANTTCDAVPAGVYCREIYIAKGMETTTWPSDTGAAITTQPYTIWVRIAKAGESTTQMVTQRDVVF